MSRRPRGINFHGAFPPQNAQPTPAYNLQGFQNRVYLKTNKNVSKEEKKGWFGCGCVSC